jgi:predicted O-linked N-acetylglucosamine transferase (SPINDLY family)
VDRSRLLILADKGSNRDRTLEFFASEGVSGDRIEFLGHRPRMQYLELYHQIDIGLDTFPANGHTTSMDSFWMGVPVVTLAGQAAIGRGGVSILSNLSLPELIAQTADEFVTIAVAMANDLNRLSSLRSTLRERMQRSPLMDAPRFARYIEAVYRTMWQHWCAG